MRFPNYTDSQSSCFLGFLPNYSFCLFFLLSVMCQDWILFINDFSINRAPESNGRKFYLTNSGSTSLSNSFIGSPTTGSESKNSGKPSTPRSALGRMRQWAGGESRSRYKKFPLIIFVGMLTIVRD